MGTGPGLNRPQRDSRSIMCGSCDDPVTLGHQCVYVTPRVSLLGLRQPLLSRLPTLGLRAASRLRTCSEFVRSHGPHVPDGVTHATPALRVPGVVHPQAHDGHEGVVQVGRHLVIGGEYRVTNGLPVVR